MAERNVNYRSETFDKLPPSDAKPDWSPYVEKLAGIVGDPAKHAPKWVLIGDYGNKDSAKGAVSQLRRRYGGDESFEGWRFEHRSVEIDGELRGGVFAQYDGRLIEPGKAEANQEAWKDYRTRQREQRREKAEAAAAG